MHLSWRPPPPVSPSCVASQRINGVLKRGCAPFWPSPAHSSPPLLPAPPADLSRTLSYAGAEFVLAHAEVDDELKVGLA